MGTTLTDSVIFGDGVVYMDGVCYPKRGLMGHNAGDRILLESGDFLLLEDGSKFLINVPGHND